VVTEARFGVGGVDTAIGDACRHQIAVDLGAAADIQQAALDGR
jgi:hypothetical protein